MTKPTADDRVSLRLYPSQTRALKAAWDAAKRRAKDSSVPEPAWSDFLRSVIDAGLANLPQPKATRKTKR